jgi:iron complex outermembrane receptor protein
VRGQSEEVSYFAGTPSRFVVAGGHQQLGGLYIQDLFTPTNHWLIQVSARLDGWTNYDAERRERILSTGALTERLFSDQLRGTVDPRVGVSYHPVENVTLRGSYYHSFRAPTLNEFYRSFRVGNVLTMANDQLGPERIKGFEAGADWRLGSRYSGRLVAFWNELDSPVSNITVSVTPTLITRLRQNIGEARAQGLEAEGNLQLNRRWAFRGAYLLSDSRVTEFPVNPSLESKRLPQVPRHRLTASVVYSNVRILEAFVSTRFVGLQYDDDLNLLPLGNFTVLDFYVSRQLRPSLRFYFSAENLFDRRFAVARTPRGGNWCPAVASRRNQGYVLIGIMG